LYRFLNWASLPAPIPTLLFRVGLDAVTIVAVAVSGAGFGIYECLGLLPLPLLLVVVLITGFLGMGGGCCCCARVALLVADDIFLYDYRVNF
jgi:hypothetical protein